MPISLFEFVLLTVVVSGLGIVFIILGDKIDRLNDNLRGKIDFDYRESHRWFGEHEEKFAMLYKHLKVKEKHIYEETKLVKEDR